MDNISGIYICPKCSHKYKWEYINMMRNRLSQLGESSDHWFSISDDVVHVSKDESMSDKNKYRFNCDCPNCNEPNSFDYIISKS